MMDLRKTGIDVLGDIPWGTHLCQFYETKEDLLELLVPYFKAGLENNEYCLWIIADPMTVDDAFHALKKAVPHFQQYVEKNSIEILPYINWFLTTGKFDAKEISDAWIRKLDEALAREYDGMRINGNETWLERNGWDNFMEYERGLNNIFKNRKVIGLCTYPLSRADSRMVLDVAHAHESVIAKRNGHWEILEQPEIKKPKAELQRRGDELEQLVAERTNELMKVIRQLKQEINERKNAEDKLIKEKELNETIKESFPGIFKIVDENYHILEWNRMFEIFTGYAAEEIPHLHTLNDLHDISDRKRAFDLHQEAFAKGTVRSDFKIRTKDGDLREVFFIGNRISYEGKTCLIICGIDVTERKKAEELLRYEKDLSNIIIESIPGYLLLIDKGYRLVLWNKQFPSMFGYTETELSNLHPVENFFPPNDWTKIYELIEQVFSTGYLSGESTILKKDGSEITVYFNARSIKYNGAECVLTVGVDITERKKAEEEIKRQVELTKEIINTIPTMIWCILPDGSLDFVNQRWMDFTGLSLAEAVEDPTRIIRPKDLPRVMRKWKSLRDAGSYYEDEMRLRQADGEYRWFLVRTAPLKDKVGNIVKWFGVSIDIEDRKRAEEKLRQNEILLLEAEKIAHIGSWSLDLRSNTVTWSDEIYRLFGINKSEFDHSLESVFNLIHPGDRDFVKRIVEETIKTHAPYDFYFRTIRPDKKVSIIHARGAVVTDAQGNAVRLFGASQDVTERKHAEDELRMAYQRLSYHVENTPLAVIEFDKELFIKRWSKRAEEIFRWKAKEALGKNLYDPDFPIIYKEDLPTVININEELMKGVVDRNFSLHRNYTRDGNVIYNEWYNSVLRDDQGNVITILSLTHDVTERKKAEERLNESYLQIRSLSEHLQKIREEERTHIAREIHDELGQNLTVMKMDASWLNKKISDDNGALKERLHDLINLLEATVQSVRKISHELRPHLLDLGLDDAIQWHLKEFEKRSGIKTSFSPPEEELELDDSTKTGLFRIFQESMTNVARHSKASHIDVELIKESNQIILRINDNGGGFDMNKAVEKQTLGILGMKERAVMMGGTYDIESEPGSGTIVTATVPSKAKNA